MKKIKPFKFKQFQIFQDKTAMKVGTDGVLLGAWSQLYNGENILDIGTGTGLISLMLAQRFNNSNIDAIELDQDAFLQATENILDSDFKDNIQVQKTSLQDFKSIKKYDLIVSNPPFFIENERTDFDARKQARQQSTLTFEELLFHSKSLLNVNGVASFIIPYDQEEDFINIGRELKLFPKRILRVKGNQNAPIKRSLLEFCNTECETVFSDLIIEVERHMYTDDYTNLTREFYLKM